MSYYYSPPPPSPSPSPSPPPPHYPYYSPPPPSPDCNKTKPPPPPPKHPKNCTMPPPSPPIIYNCTCICPTPPIITPPYHYPPPPPLTPNYPPSYNYTVEHDYKAVIAVSVSLGGILVAFLFLGVFFLAKKKKPEDVPPPPPPSPPPPPQPSYQYGAVPQTVTSTYEAIEIVEEAGGDDAAGGQSYEPVNPAPVPHDYGHQNYG